MSARSYSADAAAVEHIIVGGIAVNAHGFIRATQDLDICPDPSAENLARLANLVGDLGARQLGVEDHGFRPHEMPLDPTDPGDLAEGGNFRLATSLGILDIMQWLPGIDEEPAYEVLAKTAEEGTAFGITVRVCSLAYLRRMKQAAGRPQDLVDLEQLATAHPDE